MLREKKCLLGRIIENSVSANKAMEQPLCEEYLKP